MLKIKLLALTLCLTSIVLAQAPEKFTNPIIPGYHPDPSVCRVGDDYYLVNSSFEWFPGIPIYHSKDLVNWKLIGYGITRPNQVELPVGLKDSRGIYAVSIRYHDGLFYLITTCVQCDGNFYITAKDPAGEWSDPVWLNSRGIDPSLFWDDDGKCYYTGHANISGINDWPDKNGVWMQELDTKQGKLVGKQQQLTHGHATNARWTEGPHLYKVDSTYMLLVAEGGTGFYHSVTMFHSKNIWGPYIPYHSNPMITHRNLGRDFPVHSVGHADLFETQKGDWWAVMLGKRTVNDRTLLARETFLTPVKMDVQEGIPTPVFNPGIGHLSAEQKRPDLPWTPIKKAPAKDEFNADKLALDWNFLRTPYTQWYTLANGTLAIQTRPEVLDSMVNPSFIGRRIMAYQWEAATKLNFKSKKTNEQAGISIYRNSTNHYELFKQNKEIVLIKTMRGKREEIARMPHNNIDVILKVKANNRDLQFSFGPSEADQTNIGAIQDLEVVSDEVAAGFSGPYVAMYTTSNGLKSKALATYDWFKYEEE